MNIAMTSYFSLKLNDIDVEMCGMHQKGVIITTPSNHTYHDRVRTYIYIFLSGVNAVGNPCMRIFDVIQITQASHKQTAQCFARHTVASIIRYAMYNIIHIIYTLSYVCMYV